MTCLESDPSALHPRELPKGAAAQRREVMERDLLSIRSVTPNPNSGFISIRYRTPVGGDLRPDVGR
jgi:hypothetical protein